MNWLDRLIRDKRIRRVVRRVRPGARVLDVGCHDGALFRALGHGLREGVGLDPDLVGELIGPNYVLRPGLFPDDAADQPASFDVICALAVLEHVEGERQQAEFASAIAHLLKPGGSAYLTVPSPMVDRILEVMMRLRLLDGMETEAHHGFDVATVIPLFTGVGLELAAHERFQLRLNNLFVFRKPS
jgi:2-polyprenyl-3-methyl-5-hydroxy-6-metoxy-1,4-benzoquinol methylase